jgi:hypothetical protein
VRAREPDRAARVAAERGDRHVLVFAELADVLREHGVHEHEQAIRHELGVALERRSHRGLTHHHHEPRGHAVTRDVADQDPLVRLRVDHVVVVAAHLLGGLHARGDVAAGERGLGRHERFLDAPRELHLAPERVERAAELRRALRDAPLEPCVELAELQARERDGEHEEQRPGVEHLAVFVGRGGALAEASLVQALEHAEPLAHVLVRGAPQPAVDGRLALADHAGVREQELELGAERRR